MSLLAAIPPPPFSGLELGPLNVRMYGLVIAIGAYLALLMVTRRYERYGRDPGTAEKAALLALGGGLVGARIGYVIPRFLGEDGYLYDPVGIIAIWRGGLAFFGGLVGGALAVIVFLRVKDLTLPPMADAVAPALPLAQAFGRWGNYFNQELFGRPTELPWALEVEPEASRIASQYPPGTTFHPTFLYESLWNLGLVAAILAIERAGWLKRRGSLMFVYLIGYGLGRGWIETLRIDTAERYFGWSRNNWVSLLVVLIGIAGLVWWERRPSAPLTTDDPEPGAATDAETDGTTTDTAGATGATGEVAGAADDTPADTPNIDTPGDDASSGGRHQGPGE